MAAKTSLFFTFFETSTQLSHSLAHFAKCRKKEKYVVICSPSRYNVRSDNLTSSAKKLNVAKNVLKVQSCCFVNLNLFVCLFFCFLTFSLPSPLSEVLNSLLAKYGTRGH